MLSLSAARPVLLMHDHYWQARRARYQREFCIIQARLYVLLGCSEVTLSFVHVLKWVASSAGDGRVLLYDLMRDLEHPVKILDVCGATAPVHDLAFNVKAPELFATTDRQSVKVTLEVELFQCSNLTWESLTKSEIPHADPGVDMLSAGVQAVTCGQYSKA